VGILHDVRYIILAFFVLVRVISTLGVEKTILIFKETKRIEEEGGMLVMVSE
jgi:hypothetical protein